jgi:uncharacterized Ntn-hydrolase superfamily protein
MKHKVKILVLLALLFLLKPRMALGTFSIVAIDTATGQVGSAAASFVGDCTWDLISQIFFISPGMGAIHTQAFFDQSNASTAQNLMSMGKSPIEIVDYVVSHDATGSPDYRQYIVIDLINGGRTAGYTGSQNTSTCNHILGKNYAIAGNTLFKNVLENMQSGFLNTTGALSDRLMAALLAGKAAGGDARGAAYHLSSLVALLRVANPGDAKDRPVTLDLLVAYPSSFDSHIADPVDALKILYHQWKESTAVDEGNTTTGNPLVFNLGQNYPNPFNPNTKIGFSIPASGFVSLKIFNPLGREVAVLVNKKLPPGNHEATFDASVLPSGIYLYRLQAGGFVQTKKLVVQK